MENKERMKRGKKRARKTDGSVEMTPCPANLDFGFETSVLL
jgi:hypothetical protein